jgi:hypothetical protein
MYESVARHLLSGAAVDWPSLITELRTLSLQDWGLLRSIQLLVAMNQLDAAETLVRELTADKPAEYPQRTLRSELLRQLAGRGEIDRARRWRAGEGAGEETIRDRAQIALALVRAGRVTDAITLVEQRNEGGSAPYFTPTLAEAYATVAAAAAEVGARHEAERLVAKARDWVEMRKDDERTSRGLAAVAIAEARLGRLYRARQYADRCTRSHGKLRAYAGILRAAYP